MTRKGFLGLGIFLTLTLLGAACIGGGADPTDTSAAPTATEQATGTGGTGTLEIRVTDKPNPSISAINLTAENVEIHRADTGEWSTVVVGPGSFDLIAVTGIEELLGSEVLPA